MDQVVRGLCDVGACCESVFVGYGGFFGMKNLFLLILFFCFGVVAEGEGDTRSIF